MNRRTRVPKRARPFTSEHFVAYGEKTQPTRIEQWLEARSPGYAYGWVLLLLAATFIVMSAGPPDAWVRVVTVFLQGLTLLAALLASRTGRRLFRAASVVVVVAFLGSLASVVVSSSNDPSGAFFLLNVLLVGTAPVVIARALWRRRVVDVHTVLGAVCIYVLLGMMFSFIYAAIGQIGSDPFFVQTEPRHGPELPLLQLHHPDHRGVRRLHGRRQPWSSAGRVGSAHRPALPRDDHRSAGQPHDQHRTTSPY